MEQQQQSRWLIGRRILWAGGIATLVFLILVICGYLFGWTWTGLPKRTVWDWLDLLIVPAVLALGGYLFTRSENRRTVRSTEQQRTLDREIATQQTNTDRELADERRQDDRLQAYLDGMSQLLTDRDQPLHRAQPGDILSTVARARTLVVLGRLDGGRKGSVLQFLYESGLIYKERTFLNEAYLIERRPNIVSLQEADLSGTYLTAINLSRADRLSGTSLTAVNLSRADLSSANLRGAVLSWADLRGADLSGADLSGAELSYANLRGARGCTDDQLNEAFVFLLPCPTASLGTTGSRARAEERMRRTAALRNDSERTS